MNASLLNFEEPKKDDNDTQEQGPSVYSVLPSVASFERQKAEYEKQKVLQERNNSNMEENSGFSPKPHVNHKIQVTTPPKPISNAQSTALLRKPAQSQSFDQFPQLPKPKKPISASSKSISVDNLKKLERTPPIGADSLWYFGNITRKETESIFTTLKKNILIVRNTSKKPGSWALSLGYTNEKPAHIIISTKMQEGKLKWFLEDCSDKATYDSLVDLLVQSPECDTHAFAGSVVENTWWGVKHKSKSRTLRTGKVPKPATGTTSFSQNLTSSAPTSTFLALESS
mmetsp:Transcript_4858/g.6786  ORF Transcript_4858/g.6786 Transcript_4858/m.6786 type:complete len:285 (+) Transcript_4858:300-1154(+)